MSVVVCYHYPCIDGIFSALAAHMHYKQREQADVRFFPLTVYIQHSVDELQLQGSETVFMCDFTGPDGFLIDVAAKARRVIVLDHHKTAIEAFSKMHIPSNVELHFDLERSGATLALDYFKPNVTPDLRRAFQFVEDGDLWTWKLPGSEDFYAGIRGLELEFDVGKNPSIYDQLQGLIVEVLIERGSALRCEEDAIIAATAQTAFTVQLGGALGLERGWGSCLAVQIDNQLGKYRSRIGNELAKTSSSMGLKGIGIIAYREDGMTHSDQVKVSLRGVGEDIDTTCISQAYGGGGHRLASSCILPEKEFQTWKL
ncbi:hypothetical protein CEUSTIGMA_g6809.t1 [Chlamydomonas eustigma]|uniref:DDH domain-containing protein n=1 Tax=Chlamydomonas eustigma TaxID=1157962 RepID=A0A250X8H8_9CHLO|nr:hypothetical protein CEUSTIGMA_g6809.t1 [Chlamydomonas eustigma]|eukprot:GAX79367.1 hypothetical protein CEUSTIGMA_g6809.t1 [Chlamydomonas eustigma]